MELWQAIHFARIEDLPEIAQSAEELGITGLAFGDHQVLPSRRTSSYPYSKDGSVQLPSSAPFPDPWVVASAMAMVTTKLRFTTDVYVLPLRDPFTVAKSVATAARLSGGRVELGVGVGWLEEEFVATGMDFHSRGRRTDEMLAVMHALWAGGPITFHGEFFHFDEIELSPVPLSPIPVLIGGHSDNALRRAASHDGWIALGLPSEERARLIVRLQELLEHKGREPSGFPVMAASRDQIDTRTFDALEESGVTSIVSAPLPIGSHLADWKRAMEVSLTSFDRARIRAR
jgi:probable F420-dependent oxidoreductase